MDKDIVLEKFAAALAARGITIESVDETGLIYVSQGETSLTISLDNVRRDVERDGDDAAIDGLADAIAHYSVELPLQWEDARAGVFVSLAPNDHDFADFVHAPVTDFFDKVYTYYNGDNYAWISAPDLEKWGIDRDVLIKQAESNGDALSRSAILQREDIEGHSLVYIALEWESMKAALVFSPAMRLRIEAELGGAFCAVMPVRDFCYIFSEADLAFFSPRLGPTVVEEFRASGYPVTTEILRFSGDTVEGIGYYPFEEDH